MLLHDRRSAGLQLASKINLLDIDIKNTIVISISKEGIPIAFEVAKKCELPLDIYLLQTIQSPQFPGMQLGNIMEGNVIHYNHDFLNSVNIHVPELIPLKDKALKEFSKMNSILRREYPAVPIDGKDIILIDEGIISSFNMELVIDALKKKTLGKIILAVPVISAVAKIKLAPLVDTICDLIVSSTISNLSECFENFTKTDYEEVIDLMSEFSLLQSQFSAHLNTEEVKIQDTFVSLVGLVLTSDLIKSWIIIAQGSGRAYNNPRNLKLASNFAMAGHGVLILDLLTKDEDAFSNRFNISLLSKRLNTATLWLLKSRFYKMSTPIGFLGTGTGAAACVISANYFNDQNFLYAIVGYSSRADMLEKKTLGSLYLPTLLIMAEDDKETIELNKLAMESLPNARISLVKRDTEELSEEAINWFNDHLPNQRYFPAIYL